MFHIQSKHIQYLYLRTFYTEDNNFNMVTMDEKCMHAWCKGKKEGNFPFYRHWKMHISFILIAEFRRVNECEY